MLEFHKLNPNALLVLLGSAIYAAAGGPFVIAGGVVIGILLGLHHRRQEARGDGNGPTTLFGAPAPDAARRRTADAVSHAAAGICRRGSTLTAILR